MVKRLMTSNDPEKSSCDHNMLKAQYLENIWRCYLAKSLITIVCCEQRSYK